MGTKARSVSAQAAGGASVLYERERHETLCDTPWDGASARRFIAEVVTATDAAFGERSLRPVHSKDTYNNKRATTLYFGAAGWPAMRSRSFLLGLVRLVLLDPRRAVVSAA